MAAGERPWQKLLDRAHTLDRYLLSRAGRVQYIFVGLTFIVMVAWSLPKVPRSYVDYSQRPVLNLIGQPDAYGTDTVADMYASKVVLNDLRDMYTRERLAQTPLEESTWSKEASSPYPPLMLLSLAGLYAVGAVTGIELYGMVLLLAMSFVTLSAVYFLRTRWYLFPLLYLNFAYFAERFVSVQDGSYLVMLNVVLAALLIAGRRRGLSDVLTGAAISLKLLPLYYLTYLPTMRSSTRLVFLAVLAAGFVLPYFVWDHYLSIYGFNAGNKGDLVSAVGALAVAVPVAGLIRLNDIRGRFDPEERIGWALVPFALFLALHTNATRHLLIALLVPDKRGVRNIAAAVGLLLFALFPSVIRLGSVSYISTAVLISGLIYILRSPHPTSPKRVSRIPGEASAALAAP